MFAKLLDAIFGCWHSRCSFPMTLSAASPRSPVASLTGTYVVCLDCGKELPYDWNTMKIVSTTAEGGELVEFLSTKEAA